MDRVLFIFGLENLKGKRGRELLRFQLAAKLETMLPALALGMEPVEAGIMRQKPRNAKDSIFADGFAASMAFYGILVGAVTLIAYALGEYVFSDPAVADGMACTMSFATLVFCELTRAFVIRSEHQSIFKIGVFSNKAMNKAFAAGLIMQLAVLLIPPLQPIFSVTPLHISNWIVVIVLSLMPLIVSEISKAIYHARHGLDFQGINRCEKRTQSEEQL